MNLAVPITECLAESRFRILFWMLLIGQLALVGVGTWLWDRPLLQLFLEAAGCLCHLNCAILTTVVGKKSGVIRLHMTWSMAVCITAFVISTSLVCGLAKKTRADHRVWVGHLGTQCLLCVLVGLDGIIWPICYRMVRRFHREKTGNDRSCGGGQGCSRHYITRVNTSTSSLASEAMTADVVDNMHFPRFGSSRHGYSTHRIDAMSQNHMNTE